MSGILSKNWSIKNILHQCHVGGAVAGEGGGKRCPPSALPPPERRQYISLNNEYQGPLGVLGSLGPKGYSTQNIIHHSRRSSRIPLPRNHPLPVIPPIRWNGMYICEIRWSKVRTEAKEFTHASLESERNKTEINQGVTKRRFQKKTQKV